MHIDQAGSRDTVFSKSMSPSNLILPHSKAHRNKVRISQLRIVIIAVTLSADIFIFYQTLLIEYLLFLH